MFFQLSIHALVAKI